MHIEHDIFYICFVLLLPGRHIWSKQKMHCQQMCWAASADNRTIYMNNRKLWFNHYFVAFHNWEKFQKWNRVVFAENNFHFTDSTWSTLLLYNTNSSQKTVNNKQQTINSQQLTVKIMSNLQTLHDRPCREWASGEHPGGILNAFK